MAAGINNILRIAKKIGLVFLAVVFCYLAMLLGILFWTFEVKLHRRPLFLYAGPTVVRVGDNIDTIRLQDRLTRLGHVETDVVLKEPGQWNRSGSSFNIYLKYCPISGQGIVNGPVSLALDWNKVRSIKLLRSQEDATQLVLEPELLHAVSLDGAPELFRPVRIEEVPGLLVDAIVLTEDPYFFSHAGVDLASTHRAFITNLKAGRYVQGGSTISQQLVKMSMLSPEKTLWRKMNELALALAADAIYSKKTILEHYLNRVYFGQWGSYPLRGVAEASRHLFGKDLRELDASECALLAATIRAPNVINIYRHPERAKTRRNMVLGLLFKAGKISRDAYEEAIESPLRTLRPGAAPVKADAFVDLVKDRLSAGAPTTGRECMDVVTSLDPLAQNEAELALRKLGDPATKSYLVLLALKTGGIRVFIAPGSKKWDGAGGNLDTFLPLALVPGLTKDKYHPPKYTLTSQISVGNNTPGPMTLRKAFASNEPALARQLSQTIGADAMADMMRRFGVPAKSKADQILLTRKVNPLEVLEVYGAMALLGDAPSLTLGQGLTLETRMDQDSSRASASKVVSGLFLVNYMLKDFDRGVDKGLPIDGSADLPSVFSSTDSEGRWHVSYRSDAVLLLRSYGHQLTSERLTALMNKLMPTANRLSPDPETTPEGIVFRRVCLSSGLLATSTCPRVVKEAFLKGTQPTEWCSIWHETKPVPSNAKKE